MWKHFVYFVVFVIVCDVSRLAYSDTLVFEVEVLISFDVDEVVGFDYLVETDVEKFVEGLDVLFRETSEGADTF